LLEKLFSRQPSREGFARLVMKTLSNAGADSPHYEQAEFSVRIGKRDNVIFLENSYVNYCAADRQERKAILLRLGSFVSPNEIPQDFGTASPCLMPMVRDASYFSLVELHMRALGRDVSKLSCPTMPIAGGLVVALAYDTEHSIQHVNNESLSRWGVSLDEALRRAKANLRDRTDLAHIMEEGPGTYRGRWGDSHESARILLTDFIYGLPLAGEPIAFVPNRNQLWVTGTRNDAGLTALLEIGEEAHFAPHPISPNLFLLEDGAWVLYTPENPNARNALVALKRRREAVDYGQQKESLDVIHQKEGTDLFVASFSVFEGKDGDRYSACVWSNGVDTLLPKTDRILFMEDQNAKRYHLVKWDAAVGVVGDLMEEYLHFLPTRYRVRQFPNEKQIDELRALVLPLQ